MRVPVAMDNNETLAQVYQPHVAQTVVIFPVIWRHEDGGGDWYIRYEYQTEPLIPRTLRELESYG